MRVIGSSSSTPHWSAACSASQEHKSVSSSDASSSSSSSAHCLQQRYPSSQQGSNRARNFPPSPSSSSSDEMLHHLALRIPSIPSMSFSAIGLQQHQESLDPQPSSPVVQSPVITTLHNGESNTILNGITSPMARSRRAPPPADAPPMVLTSTPTRHTLDVRLPRTIQPEMVTVSAKKGDKLSVVADAWHMERNCHYEWEIAFPPRDVDMSSVHAKFESDGRLVINIRRRMEYHSYI